LLVEVATNLVSQHGGCMSSSTLEMSCTKGKKNQDT
jgi:hypothetical protein